jgi:hypothetical protein
MAKGVEKRVTFDGETITIHPDVFARFRAKVQRRDGGDHVIPIEDVVAVELVPSTTMLNGYLRFRRAGDDEDDRPLAATAAAAVKLATRDPDAVTFSRYQDVAFAVLRDAVAAAIDDRDTP